MKTIIEKIDIFCGKIQGQSIVIEDPKMFAIRRCNELNKSEAAKKYDIFYSFEIDPINTLNHYEFYKSQCGWPKVEIIIIRNFKKI